MFIRNCLTPRKDLKVVHPQETIQNVLSQMEQHLSLPCVAEDDQFIGLVSKRTIFDAFRAAHAAGQNWDAFITSPVDNCVDRSVVSLPLDAPFEATLEIIIRHPFVPIVESGVLLGIVKRGDIQRALAVAFATDQQAHRLLLGMAEVEGALYRLFNITHRLGLNIVTAVPFDAGDHSLNRRLILKVSRTEHLATLVDQLEKAGFLVIEVTP